MVLGFNHQADLPADALDLRETAGHASIGFRSIPPRHNFFGRGAFTGVGLSLGSAKVRHRVLFQAPEIAGILVGLAPSLSFLPIEPLLLDRTPPGFHARAF